MPARILVGLPVMQWETNTELAVFRYVKAILQMTPHLIVRATQQLGGVVERE